MRRLWPGLTLAQLADQIGHVGHRLLLAGRQDQREAAIRIQLDQRGGRAGEALAPTANTPTGQSQAVRGIRTVHPRASSWLANASRSFDRGDHGVVKGHAAGTAPARDARNGLNEDADDRRRPGGLVLTSSPPAERRAGRGTHSTRPTPCGSHAEAVITRAAYRCCDLAPSVHARGSTVTLHRRQDLHPALTSRRGSRSHATYPATSSRVTERQSRPCRPRKVNQCFRSCAVRLDRVR